MKKWRRPLQYRQGTDTTCDSMPRTVCACVFVCVRVRTSVLVVAVIYFPRSGGLAREISQQTVNV